MRALEFNAVSDGVNGNAYLYWESFSKGVKVSSGTATIIEGDFVGFVSPEGIDELRIAGYSSPDQIAGRTDFSGMNALALDTLRVKLMRDGEE